MVGGKSVLLGSFENNIEKVFIKDVGIKMALGVNPEGTTGWKGKRPTTRMGAIAILRENLLKALKTMRLVDKSKKILTKWIH